MRIAAGVLILIVAVLYVGVGFFYVGLGSGGPAAQQAMQDAIAKAKTPQEVEIATKFLDVIVNKAGMCTTLGILLLVTSLIGLVGGILLFVNKAHFVAMIGGALIPVCEILAMVLWGMVGPMNIVWSLVGVFIVIGSILAMTAKAKKAAMGIAPPGVPPVNPAQY